MYTGNKMYRSVEGVNSMKWAKRLGIVLLLLTVLTSCNRYTFFDELTDTVKEETGDDPYNQEIDKKMEQYSKYDAPDAFTEEALEDIAKLSPVMEKDRYTYEENYETIEISTIEMPDNPYEVRSSDPDHYVDTATDLLNSYFDYFVVKAGGNKNASEENKIDYLKVIQGAVIAGNIDEFVIETLVEIHVPDVKNTVYEKYGILGNDNAIHCELTIHGKKRTDYTFELIGIIQAEEARKVIDTDITFVRAEPKKFDNNCYQIIDDTLSVSYNGGDEWVSVPITMDRLFAHGDGNGAQKSTTLELDSYIISPEKTAFIYGGSSQYPVTVILSDDEGETWKEVIVNESMNIRRNFISYIGNAMHVLSCGDRTMGQEWSELYSSTDGGNNWSKKAAPFQQGSFLVTSFKFINENIGFITVRSSQSPSLYRTENSGDTWEKVDINMQDEWYTMAYAPEKEEEGLSLYVGMEEYEEMEGTMWKLISNDEGISWQKQSQVMR